jgi:hypothetical protein
LIGADSVITARRFLGVFGPVILGLFLATAVLSVNMFPIVGNDSVRYLGHSLNLAEGGFVEEGYRQFGYPFFLALTRWLSDLVGGEPLFTTVLVQRLLLIAAGLAAWRLWRWWSLPVLAFLFSAQTVAYTDLLLTESLAVSLGVLLVLPTVRFLQALERDDPVDRSRLVASGALIAIGVITLYALRFTFIVFAAVPALLAVRAWRTHHRRLALTVLGVSVLVMGVMALATSFENQREQAEFGPSVRDEPVRYYFAWQQVFTVRPENQQDPSLARYWDEGVVHDFGREVPVSDREAWEREILDMTNAAGLSMWDLRARSFFSALSGGQLNDIPNVVMDAVLSTRITVDELSLLNTFSMENGVQAFVDTYNGGQYPATVITDPLGSPSLIPGTKAMASVVAPLALLVMVVGVFLRSSRWLAFIGLAVVLSFALGMGWLLTDNLRFLMPTTGFGITVACGVASMLPAAWRGRRRPASPSETINDDQGEDGVAPPEEPHLVDAAPQGMEPAGLNRSE